MKLRVTIERNNLNIELRNGEFLTFKLGKEQLSTLKKITIKDLLEEQSWAEDYKDA